MKIEKSICQLTKIIPQYFLFKVLSGRGIVKMRDIKNTHCVGRRVLISFPRSPFGAYSMHMPIVVWSLIKESKYCIMFGCLRERMSLASLSTSCSSLSERVETFTNFTTQNSSGGAPLLLAVHTEKNEAFSAKKENLARMSLFQLLEP